MAGYGTSLAGIEPNAAGYGDLVPGIVRVPPDDTQAFAQLLEERPGEVAAFFGEPVRGAGGVCPPPEGYWTEIQRLCRGHDVLLVADEVITGFGRMGSWFGSARYGIEPDIMIGAKGITSGYLPLGVTICGQRVQEPFWRGNAGMFRHGYTYSGHATACAVGLANLDLIQSEKLVDRAAALEHVLAAEISRLADHPLVEEIRCAGLLAAIEISAEARGAAPKLADFTVAEARRNGVLTRALVGRALQISPPLVITREEIRQMVDGLSAALTAAQVQLSSLAAV
jgi:adenosylmethionine-8-amino-7-oxononanoate aminotransferase